ncbi:hypothetical protein ACOMHN_037843 [Nucella lapillus]
MHEVMYDVDLGAEHEIRRRSVDQPLRIHLHFDQSLNFLPEHHGSLIKSEVREAVHYWERTLKVRATQAPIRLRRQCASSRVNYWQQRAYCINKCAPVTVCGEIVIPPKHLEGCYKWDSWNQTFTMEANAGPGVKGADFILYIASIDSPRCQQGQTVAYAAHCQQERALDRPVAGYFSICPQSISDSWQERQQLRSTMKHEILHALGFTAGLYAFYRDADGKPLTERSALTGKPANFDGKRAMYIWSDKVVKMLTRMDWSTHAGTMPKIVNMMVTPKVKREVRRHFNCPSLEGAELEDQGIDGTAITHWEKRVFENEAMTGTYTQNSVISRITLAMMEDTGWYKADYSMAEDYEWGRGLGCEFVTKSCYHWISTRLARNETIYPYCRRVKRGELWTDCTHNRHAVALCNLVEYQNPLPVQYQRGCRGGRKKLCSIQVVPSRNLHPLMVPPFLQPHPDLQSAGGNAPLSSKHPTQLPTTDCLLSIIPLMGGQPSDAPALSPPSPLQQGGQSSNAPALSPPSPLPQGGQPIALALSPSSPPPQDGQPSDSPGLSPSSSTLLLCPSDSTLSICHLNSQSAVKTVFRDNISRVLQYFSDNFFGVLQYFRDNFCGMLQYFRDNQLDGVAPGREKRYAGSVMLADFCPYLQEFSWTSQRKTIRGSSCLMEENKLKVENNFFGEYYGKHSRCFKHEGQWFLYKCSRVNTPQHSGSGCYKVRCEQRTGLWVEVGNQSYPCYHKGYVHRLSFLFNSGYLHEGAIVCPACKDICP